MSDKRNVIPIAVSPNLKREKVWIDSKGNKISGPKGHIIEAAAEEPQAPAEAPAPEPQTLSVKQLRTLIEQKEDELDSLKSQLKTKVRELRKELEELEELE